MGRPIRHYVQDGMYFVTARATQGRMLLRPSTQTNELIGGVLARAAQRFPVEVHGFVFTSNHVHLLLRARDGCLSAFMQFLLGNIARKVGRLVSWRNSFWERRFSAEPVLDEIAAEDRLRYILAHGVKEGLVRKVEQWPGISCVAQLLGARKRTFRWFHWARRWRGRRIREDALGLFDDALAENVTLELKPLPAWSGLSDVERRHRAQALIDDIEAKASEAFQAVIGAEKVSRQRPDHRPKRLERSPRPLCHAGTREGWLAWRDVHRAFKSMYRQASERYRRGDGVAKFPELSFLPPRIRGLTISLAAI